MKWDAIVAGAGHNGLIAACYLAKAGLRVLVLERRSLLGGASVSEELAPGFTVSTASYSLSLLRPDVYNDLELGRHGLEMHPKDPQMFVPLPDGRHFFVWRDAAKTKEEISRIHAPDGDAYDRYNAFWDEALSVLRPYAESALPPTLDELEKELNGRGKQEIFDVAVRGSVADCVSRFFESDELRGAYASQGIIGTYASPRHPGTAWVMAYHYLGGELNGADGTWAYVKGGMGGVSSAIAACAGELGVKMRTDSPIDRIICEGGSVRGVSVGEQIYESDLVLSNCDPKTTYLGLVGRNDLPPEVLEKVSSWRTDGCVLKVNLALDSLPEFAGVSDESPGPQHFGTIEISPSIEYLTAAFESAERDGHSAMPFMEVFIQSATDKSLAPEGKHVLSAFAQYIRPSPEVEDWERIRETAFECVIEVISAYAPGLRDSILTAQALGPLELEERFGLSGGDIFHGSILPQQAFGNRFPYRSGIEGLYLCGSGASPGGGVMGAAGRNAAKVALADRPQR